MSTDKLYIIGNGFDIFHGVQSRYSDFRHYLSSTDNSLYELAEEFILVEENWADLEEALARIDVDSIVDAASQFLASYGAEDWSDAYHHDYQYEVNRIVEGLSKELKKRFIEWVKQLNIPNLTDNSIQPLNLSKAAKFLTFNYTSSLSSIYKIPRENILYIHGEAQSDQDLVLGHAWNPSEIQSLNNIEDPESLDTRVMEGNEIINDYFGETFKDTQKIVALNKSFFISLKNISTIYVLGHSLSSVDFEYFQEIVNNIQLDSVEWKISYYDIDELERHKKTMKNLGVSKSKITFCGMSEF